jgi:hypothetical protein
MRLDLRAIDFVVFGVGANEPNVADAVAIIEFHHQPIVVPGDIEDHAVAGNDARIGIVLFDVCRGWSKFGYAQCGTRAEVLAGPSDEASRTLLVCVG